MLAQFKGKKISAVYSVLPTNEVDFMDEVGNYAFTEAQMKKLKKVMGFGTRRVAIAGETVGDYAIYAVDQMLKDGVFKENEIGAIIGISAKNVSVRLVRIREQLKAMSNE